MFGRLRQIGQQEKVLIEYNDAEEKTIIITLNRPKKLNAMNGQLLDSLHQAVDRVASETKIESVIFTSSVERSFSSGIDTGFINNLRSREDVAEFFYRLQDLFEKIVKLDATTIAAIEGYAFGAGADLALSCDLRIANRDTSFRFPGPQFGVVLGTQRLIEEIGASKARKLVLLNERIGVEDALSYGLIHEVQERETLQRAIHISRQLKSMPTTTERTIRTLCRKNDTLFNVDAREHAKQSILEIDFHKTFNQFLQESRT